MAMSNRTVDACPHCDGTSLSTGEEGFYCHDCYTHVAEPTERSAKSDADTRHGLAADLVAADPDEVGAE